MAIDWSYINKRRAFREALQQVYPSGAALKMFVDEEMNEDLAVIVDCGADLAATAHRLMMWAEANGRLDEMYEAFKRENHDHLLIEELEE